MRAGALVLLAAVSCGRCERRAAPDAGAKVERPSVDLRTALFTLYPEFRYSRIAEGRASYRRRLRWKLPPGGLPAALGPLVAANGFAPQESDAGFLALRRPFELSARQQGEEVSLELGLPIGDEEVGKLLHTPAPMTSEHLATYLPLPGGAEVTEEEFLLSIDYLARAERCDFLIRQLVGMLLQSGWNTTGLPPGWGADGGLPQELELEVGRGRLGTRIRVERRGERVRLEYRQPVRGAP